jgi:hypothetical protein
LKLPDGGTTLDAARAKLDGLGVQFIRSADVAG